MTHKINQLILSLQPPQGECNSWIIGHKDEWKITTQGLMADLELCDIDHWISDASQLSTTILSHKKESQQYQCSIAYIPILKLIFELKRIGNSPLQSIWNTSLSVETWEQSSNSFNCLQEPTINIWPFTRDLNLFYVIQLDKDPTQHIKQTFIFHIAHGIHFFFIWTTITIARFMSFTSFMWFGIKFSKLSNFWCLCLIFLYLPV